MQCLIYKVQALPGGRVRHKTPVTIQTILMNHYLCNKSQAMKAIEIRSKTDEHGNLKIDYPLNKKDSNVRVIILLDDDYINPDDEKLWLKSISKNPAFDFLNDPGEDIYTSKSGEPIND